MMAVLVVIEAVVLVLLTLLVAGLLRSHAEILRQLHALGVELEPAGSNDAPITLRPRGDKGLNEPLGEAHDIVGSGLHDDAMSIPVTGVRHRTLLAFLSSGCLTCREFWSALGDEKSLGLPDDVRVLAVTMDAAEESRPALRDLAPPDLPVIMSSDAWRNYDVPGSPYFILIDGDNGRVQGEGTGVTWDQVRNLIMQAGDDMVDIAREQRVDRELLAGGIEPGHPSLYQSMSDESQSQSQDAPA